MVPTTDQAVSRVVEHLISRNPELAGRLERAQQLVQAGGVDWSEDLGIHIVTSQSNPAGAYQISLADRTCTCPDRPRAPRGWCKHLLAVTIVGLADRYQARAALAVATSPEAGQWRQLVRRAQRLAVAS